MRIVPVGVLALLAASSGFAQEKAGWSDWIDQYESYPGPIMIQTDHGDVDFRKLRLRGIIGKKSFPETPPTVLGLEATPGKGPDGFGHGITLNWRTAHHHPVGKFVVYRGSSADLPTDQQHKRSEVKRRPPYTDGFFQESSTTYIGIAPVRTSLGHHLELSRVPE